MTIKLEGRKLTLVALLLGIATTALADQSLISFPNFTDLNRPNVLVPAGKRIDPDSYQKNGKTYYLSLGATFEISSSMNTPALLVPYMGGKVRLYLDDKLLFTSTEEDKSIEGFILPIPTYGTTQFRHLRFEFICRQTTFCGFWRGIPKLGDFQTLKYSLDKEYNQETITPLISALLLLIISLALVLLSFGLKKTKGTNHLLAFFIFSWGIYFLSYSGYIRKFDGLAAAIVHFPIRSITSIGLLLFIDSYFSSQTPRFFKRSLVAVISLATLVQCALGYFSESVLTLKISSAVNLIAFSPLFFISYRTLSGIRKLALILGYIAFFGQIRDSAMLFGGGILFKSQTMYVNKYTLPPFVSLAFVDHLLNYISLSLRDRVFKTQSKLTNLFSIKAGRIFTKDELVRLYKHFLSRLVFSEGKIKFLTQVFHSQKASETSELEIETRYTQQIVLQQILEANSNRIDEYDLRSQTERKIASLVKQLDPNLFEYIQSNLAAMSDSCIPNSTERGIIFFDQKGYTTLLENLDEADAYRLAESVNRWVSEKTARYAARIRNFNGDAYTLELYPLPNETTELLGVRTCNLVWELSQSIDELNRELFKNRFDPIIFRFGAHLGKASGVKLDFITPGLSNIVGDNVNIAARLQTIARPGSVYISGDLASLCSVQFLARRVPRSFVKGRKRELEVYEIVGRFKDDADKMAS